MLQTFKQSYCLGFFVECALCRSHWCFHSGEIFWSCTCESLCALSSILKWCVGLWSGSVCVCVSVEEEGRPHWTKPQSLSTHLRGVLQRSSFILSNHWLDKVEELRLLSAEKRSALFWVRKYTRELRKWHSHTPEYTMDSLCKLSAHISLFYPTSLSLLSFLLVSLCRLSSPLRNCGDPHTATSAEYQHTLNAISLKFSRELAKGEEYGREMELKADLDVDSVGWKNDKKPPTRMSVRAQHFDHHILKSYFTFYLSTYMFP